MNKETKVGLLVGLSFIVLFGVILSNQAPDIVAPPEKPMLAPARPHSTHVEVVRQIDVAPAAPEPVDVTVDAADEQAPAPVKPLPEQAVKPDAALADASPKPADTTPLTASHPEQATKTITADNLGPETTDAEPGDDASLEVVSSKIGADGSKTTVYIVKNGDSLAKIARQVYGDASNRSIDKIFEANKAKMPNKKTLAVGTKLQVPVKAPSKDKNAADLLNSGKFDEVADVKPPHTDSDTPKAKNATAARPTKDIKDVKETKDAPNASPKDARKVPAKSALADASSDTMERFLLERVSSEQTSETRTTSNDLARAVEPVDQPTHDTDLARADKNGESALNLAPIKADKNLDKAALASRENCKHYQIQKGDTWYRLAAKFMGDSKRWHELCALNNDILPDDAKLRTGLKIRVPAAGKARLDTVVE